jgi:hypothetical protein
MGLENAGLTHEINNHKGMSREDLSSATHAFCAMRNLTDNSRFLTHIGRELTRCEAQYNRARRILVDSVSKRGRKFHEMEPGVPPLDTPNPLESNAPAISPVLENEPRKPDA